MSTQTTAARRSVRASRSASVRSKGRPGRRAGWTTPVLGFVGILAFLGVWELAPALGIVQAQYLPPASEVLASLAQDLGLALFWKAVGDTMSAWALGLAIAVVLATALGLLIGMSTFLRRATNSTIEFLRPIPSVGLIPLAVLLFGIKMESTLMLVVYASFWQVLIQVLYGVADVDAVAMNTAKSYGFSWWQRVRDVVFPTVLPYLMTGVRLAASVALILAITAELVIGSPGLGREIALAQSGGAISGMYALILATGLLGVVVNLAARWVERRVLSWHPSIRGEVAA
ncbi:ABC transporter permease [Sinomonas atrocyanea]|uniref:ABC transporter permease n=1 Tax=Sinomonas atrocyanea TaxID=37927 RepID=UPI002789FB0E|nr:ABC transporter permease [Sinomonas atrocyanea]MDQ0259282.1 ABC-type nitrate/sulfonate/bicarbonate transport system permease component [Sinomonas atrocyanea]MDR6622591.1 ABC-type nitrate/sulfonate/bicarbonate transport system permease component [Sinomonas atrocyanea]